LDAGGAALLRRPFSIFGTIRSQGGVQGIELLYKVVGQVTERMTSLVQGQRLNLLGPLGNGFGIVPNTAQFFFVAGGIGIAPVRFLASHLKSKGYDLSGCRVFLGGRSSDDLLCREDFEAHAMQVTLTTDDGSVGDQCVITDPVASALQDDKPQMIYACGPHAMLQCLVGIARQYDIPCQVSMESMMACGIGACLGCAIASAEKSAPYLHVCKDGPVFDATQLMI
jgi:dihydroorotate dehydrogenase electron transfer subunit